MYIGVAWSTAGATPSLLPERISAGTVIVVAEAIDETPLVDDSAGARPIIVFIFVLPFVQSESAAKNAAPPPIECPIKAVSGATP